MSDDEKKQDNVKEGTPREEIRLIYRNVEDKKLFGVCAGLADYFRIEPLIIRLLMIILALAGGAGFFAYLICLFMTSKRD